MKLNKIIMTDFRQFVGTQQIEFASGEENITIIFGENGKGKTGIFRAMMFGLFGEKVLNQDDVKANINLVNLNKLEENRGAPTTASVEVHFEEKDCDYKIYRSITAVKRNGSILDQNGTVRLEEYNKRSSLTNEITNPEEVKARVNKILEQNIREFFFFDAEKIDTLSSAKTKVKSVVKQGIIKILQIDLLEDGIKTLNKSIQAIENSIKKNTSDVSLKLKMDSKESNDRSLVEVTKEIDNYEEEYLQAQNQLENISLKLQENHEIKEITIKIRDKQELLKSKHETVNEMIKAATELSFKDLHSLLLEQEYSKVYESLSLKLQDNKSFIPRSLLELTLEKERCFLCQNNLEHQHSILEEIQLLLEKNSIDTSGNMFSMQLTSSISDYEIDRLIKQDYLRKTLKEIESKRQEFNEILISIKDLENSIDSIAAKEINFSDLEKSKKKIENDLRKIDDALKICKYRVNDLTERSKQLDKEISELNKKDLTLRREVRKVEYLKELRNILENISESYCDDMRIKLMNTTTDIVKTLIAKEDRNIIDKVKINEKYEIEVYGWQGNNITQDLSQGQRQMVSLAFISALAKLASKGIENIDFPLFMDTPFGRVSGENRDNLIKNMPKFTSQWILLFTDTELTSSEEKVFRSHGKLGKAYRLNQLSEGVSKIVEVSDSELLSTRGLN